MFEEKVCAHSITCHAFHHMSCTLADVPRTAQSNSDGRVVLRHQRTESVDMLSFRSRMSRILTPTRSMTTSVPCQRQTSKRNQAKRKQVRCKP